MKHAISAVIFMMIITFYLFIKNAEFAFFWACWMAGYCKNLFEIRKK